MSGSRPYPVLARCETRLKGLQWLYSWVSQLDLEYQKLLDGKHGGLCCSSGFNPVDRVSWLFLNACFWHPGCPGARTQQQFPKLFVLCVGCTAVLELLELEFDNISHMFPTLCLLLKGVLIGPNSNTQTLKRRTCIAGSTRNAQWSSG